MLLGACAALPPPLPARLPSPEVAALLARAELLLAEDAPEAARALVDRACALEPGAAEVLRLVQATRVALGDDIGVRRDAEAARAAAPGDAMAAYLLARVEEDPDAAEALLEEAVRADPSHLWARLGLAQAAHRGGDLSRAAALLASAEVCAPGHGWPPLLSALVALDRKEVPAAVALLEEALARDPEGLRARLALASLLARIPGGEARARALYAEATARAPGDRGLAERARQALPGATPEELRAFLAALESAPGGVESAGGAARHLR
jgi:tetratricopeptide (TPR) repeat protein